MREGFMDDGLTDEWKSIYSLHPYIRHSIILLKGTDVNED